MKNEEMSLRTKQALAASLKRAVLKKPLFKISVRELIEDCGVNRKTFRCRFDDIYALVKQFDLASTAKKQFCSCSITRRPASTFWTAPISLQLYPCLCRSVSPCSLAALRRFSLYGAVKTQPSFSISKVRPLCSSSSVWRQRCRYFAANAVSRF